MRSWRFQVRDLKKEVVGFPGPGSQKKEVVASQARDLKKRSCGSGPWETAAQGKIWSEVDANPL